MELTPKTKPPLEMTMGQLFERLAVIMEVATLEDREQFKPWLEGAGRMDQDRQQRLRSS